MKTSDAAGTVLILLAVSGLMIYFGKLTLDKMDSGQWGLSVLGGVVTIGLFVALVVLIKGIGSKDGDDKNE